VRLINIKKVLGDHCLIWLPAFALAAVPFGRTAELFVLIMAVVGLNDLLRNRNQIRQNNAVAMFTLFFALFFLPSVLSLFDAVNVERSTKTVLGMLRFYLVGVFIISRVERVDSHLKLGLAFAFIVLFWAIDGWIQAVFGADLIGFPAASISRVSGIFDENARLGLMIVPFLGIAFFAVKKQFGLNWAIGLSLLLSATILISGDRAAWVSLMVTVALLIVLFRRHLVSITWRQSVAILVGFSAITIAVLSIPQFNNRLGSALVGLDGSYESINKASSSRLPLWTTAFNMFADNPINGVGARSFRYAYPDYASKDDPFVDYSQSREKQRGQTHAHQVVLEFASDTGFIGVIGYVVAIWLIYIKWLPTVVLKDAPASAGYVVSLAVVLFPLNTHQSFFSSHWGQIVWMLAALAISAMASECGIKRLSVRNTLIDS
jgi:O-antigen ligase